MISLDQVLLLEQKVESAVAKIAQLQAENDALRSRCSELTNALSSKSEQLSSFESDQNKIENGILKALDRLNSIENSVLRAAGQVPPSSQAAQPAFQGNPQTNQNTFQNTVRQPVQAPARPAPAQPAAPVQRQPQPAPVQQPIINASEMTQNSAVNPGTPDESSMPGFFDLDQSPSQPAQNDAAPDNGQFDIF